MYNLLFLLLFLFASIEMFSKPKRDIYILFFIISLAFVSIRYGQGSDYFNYIYLFNKTAEDFENMLFYSDIRYVSNEIGFSFTSFIWLKMLSFSAGSLTMLYSALSFFFVGLFIKKYSIKPLVSLFIFYCTFYLIYPFSAIRQGVCLSVFVYFMIPKLHKRRYFSYYLYSLLLVLIHSSSIILFVIPIVNLIKKYSILNVALLSGIMLSVGLVLYKYLFSFFASFDVIGGKVEHYSMEDSMDILSLMLRTVIL